MNRYQKAGFLLLGGWTALGVWSCVPEPEPTVVPTQADPHTDFPLLGRHLSVDCESCHVAGAAEQGLESTNGNGWVDALDPSCLGCHTDTREAVFPGQNHGNAATCSEAGCHASSDLCWRQVRGPCVDVPTPEPGVTPPPFGHEGDRGLLFPLEGVHADIGCGTCHDGASDAEQAGGATQCEMCHTRADGPGVDHYVHPQGGGDSDRGCKACHATEAADTKLIVPYSWFADFSRHDFIWPHNGAVDCKDCHTTPGSQSATDYDCSGCHGPDATPLTPFHDNVNGACHDCHDDGL